MNSTLKNILIGGTTSGPWVGQLGIAILRVAAGLALALGHGLGKMPPSPRFIEGVQNMGFPAPTAFAWAAGITELMGGVLLALGLFTRPSAFLVACTMAVAGFIRHARDPFEVKEKALLYLAVAVMFMLHGAGRFGVDAFFTRRGR